MVRWCAYCQRFIGESPPFEDLALTHGMCDACSPLMRDRSRVIPARTIYLRDFHANLSARVSSGDLDAAVELCDDGLAQGIRPVDLLLGLVLPALRARPDAAGEHEAIFQLARQIATKVREAIGATLTERPPDVLLVAVHGTQHTLGLTILELWLHSEGIHVVAVPTGVTPSGARALVARTRPMVFGVWISTAEQADAVRELITVARDELLACPPLVLAVGPAVRSGCVKPEALPGAISVLDDAHLFLLLKSHLALRFIYDLKRKAPA